jgi:hypothetical protein
MVLIADLNEPLPADPFDGLKSRLFTAHQLTDIQRMEKLLIHASDGPVETRRAACRDFAGLPDG